MTKEVGVIWGRKILVELAGPWDQQLREFEIVQTILRHVSETADASSRERAEFLYYRGENMVLRMDTTTRRPDVEIFRHREVVPIGKPGNFDGSMVEHFFEERFRRAPWQCPNCKCVVYNSENWLEIPPWLAKQEEERGIRMEQIR